MFHAMFRAARAVLLTLLAAGLGLAPATAETPPIPPTAPVLLPGQGAFENGVLMEHEVFWAMGRAGQHEDLAAPGAWQQTSVRRMESDGREVLRRVHEVRRPDSDAVLMRASIDLDPDTLLPLVATTSRGGDSTRVEYDWSRHVVRTYPGSEGAEFGEVSLDLAMFEVGAHDLWIAVLPLREGFTARLPTYFASSGTKYWAVPRVVGSERVQVGGSSYDAWVVEVDWWGMGAANTEANFSSGGGDGVAGAGGKYWVLKRTVADLPRVVRIRTSIGSGQDSVLEVRAP
ncbi:MAG: hypothetical protein MPN21_24690 [Thermoanaerobaculia bacterium]|nr:hypothetical protein [Thermoanaerobaculia bacterium]